MEKLLLSAEEAGEVLNLCKSTVYDLIRLRMLTSVKVGKRRLIPTDACRELVERLVATAEEEVSL